jgi:yecA family protein
MASISVGAYPVTTPARSTILCVRLAAARLRLRSFKPTPGVISEQAGTDPACNSNTISHFVTAHGISIQVHMMPTSDQFKLLRSGGVRVGAQPGTYSSRSGRLLPAPDKLVPNFEALGQQPFHEEHLHRLTQRLQAPNWPKGTLNIYGLEGLLTALLVLPLSIRPTVWLPLVWNESGWKIPVALQSTDEFQDFMELLGGFMRTIDTDLCATPPRPAFALDNLAAKHRPRTLHPQRDWAQGFGLAISQSNYLTVPVDDVSQRALYAIAIHAKPLLARTHPPSTSSPRAFREAIITLARLRTSRGPLGSI